MAKGNVVKILEGAVAGIALGVAGSMFLASKTGKKVTVHVKGTLADFYKYIAPKIKKIEKMGETEYKVFIKNSAQQYGKIKKMSEEEISELIKEAQKSWNHFTKHLVG